jgi:hypothetical protein
MEAQEAESLNKVVQMVLIQFFLRLPLPVVVAVALALLVLLVVLGAVGRQIMVLLEALEIRLRHPHHKVIMVVPHSLLQARLTAVAVAEAQMPLDRQDRELDEEAMEALELRHLSPVHL